MQRRAAGSILMASLPIARTDLRTKWTSISVAYLGGVSGGEEREEERDIRGIGGRMGDALPQLSEDFLNIILICKHKYQLKLRHLDIDRVVIFAKEHTNIVP